MKKMLLCVCVGLALATAPASGAGVVVVAHPSVGVSDVSAADLKEIFLGNKTSVGGADVQPVLAESGVAHEAFLKDYVGKSPAALKNHFKSLVFTGKGSMPKSFGSDAEIVKYVAATKGAIGYVSSGAEGAGVKTIAVK
jgi:ABC-type phosphate transport system substrate-binding protein